jgi:hypothetical protein
MPQVTCQFCKQLVEPVQRGSVDPIAPVSLEFSQCPKCGAVIGTVAIAASGIVTRLAKIDRELERLSDELASHSH